MAERIDALSGSRGPWPTRGALLTRELDADLQTCVAEAAATARAPMALVTLVLRRTQLLRAHVGLPEDLRVAQATDRASSFCQFVVRDGAPFEVTDAATDERLPQDLVARYGVRAYLGVPVVTDGVVVGSLCVLDTVARSFTDDDRGSLLALGQRASERLQQLAETTEPSRQRLLRNALAPAFGEIRNVLVPMKLSVAGLRLLSTELEPLVALLSSNLSLAQLRRGLDAQPRSAGAARDLSQLTDELETAYGRLESSFVAVTEAVSESPSGAPLRGLIRTGLKLALHSTKLIGGVELEECSATESVACTTALGAAVISVCASALASHCVTVAGPRPLRCNVDLSGPQAVVTFSTATGFAPGVVDGVAAELAELTADIDTLTVEPVGSSVRLVFKRDPAVPPCRRPLGGAHAPQ